MRASVSLLLEMRDVAGVDSSPYLFANSMSSDLRPLRGCDCLRRFAQESGISNPGTITSTRLRKHIATMSQVLNLKNNELDMLATFLGHDIRVHREVYRMSEATTQLAMVSKLLLASEKGLGQWRGKSLGEIEMRGMEYDTEIATEEYDSAGPSRVADDGIATVECDSAGPSRVAGAGEGQLHEEPDEDDPDEPPRKRGKKLKSRRPWTKNERDAVGKHSSVFLEKLQVPGKADCEKIIRAESGLSQRTWTDVKNCIYNQVQKLRKLGR